MIVDPIANPYRPGAGRRPPVLAGRQPLLDAFEVVRQRAENYGEGDRSWILNGRRGVGKTVLLNELWTQVSGRGWISAKVEASWHVPFPVVLAKALVQADVPVFGICLGHQILGLAMGGTTYKLKFGHRGANHPVKQLVTGKIEITSQNHGFAVDPASLPDDVELITEPETVVVTVAVPALEEEPEAETATEEAPAEDAPAAEE